MTLIELLSFLVWANENVGSSGAVSPAAASAAGLVANLIIPGNQITATGSVTGLGAGSENVIDLSQVNMSNGNFTINGTATETFIFRVSGQFNVGNSTIRVAGGVTPAHVLWYFPNTSTIKSPNGAWDGTILALNSPVQLDNTPTALGPVHGAIIASDDVNNNQNWVFSIVSGFSPCDMVKFPCGSRSTRSTR